MMAIYAPPPPPFNCAICSEPQMRSMWENYRGAQSPIPPLCRWCESHWGQGGDKNSNNRDRRILRQVSALAEVLQATAYCKMNGHRGPYDRT